MVSRDFPGIFANEFEWHRNRVGYYSQQRATKGPKWLQKVLKSGWSQMATKAPTQLQMSLNGCGIELVPKVSKRTQGVPNGPKWLQQMASSNGPKGRPRMTDSTGLEMLLRTAQSMSQNDSKLLLIHEFP